MDCLIEFCAGRAVELQGGCREVLLRAALAGASTHVVSANWSSTLLRAALAQRSTEPPPPPSGSQAAASGTAAAAAGAAPGDSQSRGGVGLGTDPGSGDGRIQEQLGAGAGLSEEDKEAPVPDTAAAYQVFAVIKSAMLRLPNLDTVICASAICKPGCQASQTAKLTVETGQLWFLQARAAGAFGSGSGEALTGSPADIGDGLQVGAAGC